MLGNLKNNRIHVLGFKTNKLQQQRLVSNQGKTLSKIFAYFLATY